MRFAEQFGLLGEPQFFKEGDHVISGEGLAGTDQVHGWALDMQGVASVIRCFEKRLGHARRDDMRRLINHRLEDLISPRLDWNSDSAQLQLSYAPKNLLGAIWLQLAFALGYDKKFPHCLRCGRPFEISLNKQTGNRADSVFCSDKCKSADYRDRKRTARQLASKNVPLRQIATEVRSDVATVRDWVKDTPVKKRPKARKKVVSKKKAARKKR